MGTRFEFVVADELAAEGAASRALAPALRGLTEEALEVVAGLDRRLSRFRRDGVPAALARESSLRLPLEEVALFELCRRAHARSRGAFDPAITTRTLARAGLRDEAEGVAATFASIQIDRRGRRVRAPAGLAPLDFGGVAKGYALDLAARVLTKGGVRVALLHGGTSSVVALGAPPGCSAWSVALNDPTDRTRSLATIALRDAALSVSAPHGREVERDGRRVGHVVDPRDGTSVERVRLAAVVARHGATAEIASTALLILAERALREGRPVESCATQLPPSS